MCVFFADHTIRRIECAMVKNQASIADLEHQLAFRSQELTAIQNQVHICQERARQQRMKAYSRARTLAVLHPAKPVEPEIPIKDDSLFGIVMIALWHCTSQVHEQDGVGIKVGHC